MTVSYAESRVALADGETASLRKPACRIATLGYGPLAPTTRLPP